MRQLCGATAGCEDASKRWEDRRAGGWQTELVSSISSGEGFSAPDNGPRKEVGHSEGGQLSRAWASGTRAQVWGRGGSCLVGGGEVRRRQRKEEAAAGAGG